jgi:hypothetical protein
MPTRLEQLLKMFPLASTRTVDASHVLHYSLSAKGIGANAVWLARCSTSIGPVMVPGNEHVEKWDEVTCVRCLVLHEVDLAVERQRGLKALTQEKCPSLHHTATGEYEWCIKSGKHTRHLSANGTAWRT